MKGRKWTVLTLECLEDRYCPSGGSPFATGQNNNAWNPVDAGNLYSDKNNWSNKVVPSDGAPAGFNKQISNAPCNVDGNPNTPFILSNGYTGLITFGTNNLGTAVLTGITEATPAADSFNAKILDGCLVYLSGANSSTLYNCNISVADNNAFPFSIVNGAVLNLDTTTGATETINNTFLVNDGGTLNIGDPQFKTTVATIQWNPIVNNTSLWSSAIIDVGGGGAADIRGGNTDAALINSTVSSSFIYVTSSNTQNGTMNFVGGHEGIATTIDAGLAADSGGIINFLDGSEWDFTGDCSAVGRSADSIVLDPRSTTSSILNLNGNSTSSATVLDLVISCPGAFEDIYGNVYVYSSSMVDGRSSTLNCAGDNFFYNGTLAFEKECLLQGATFNFVPPADGSFNITELIDSKGNSSLLLANDGHTISFGEGTTLLVTQVDPQNQLPDNTVWLLFSAGQGIIGDIPAGSQTLPPSTTWLNDGYDAGVQT